MRKKYWLQGLAIAMALGMSACGDDESSSSGKVVPPAETCDESYDINGDFAYWKADLSDFSFVKKEICERATKYIQDYVETAVCVDVRYDDYEERFEITMLDDGELKHLYAQIWGCNFNLGSDGAYYSLVNAMGHWTFSSCLCKEDAEGNVLYRQSADKVTFPEIEWSNSSEEDYGDESSSSKRSLKSSSSMWGESSSSRFMESSSNREASSSSRAVSSSSRVASSSSLQPPVESSSSAFNEESSSSEFEEGSSSSEREKVVAAHIQNCMTKRSEADLSSYTVAYEFNDQYDLGYDEFEKNFAYLGAGTPEYDCDGYLVLDGKSGLMVPLSNDFKNKGFEVEVRFMATAPGDIANIIVAEPPGRGADGWQIRLDEVNGVQRLMFHVRDAEIDGVNWTETPIGDEEIAMDEWHTVRVKIFPTKSEWDGVVFYSLNLSLDGNVRFATEFKGDVSQIDYDLGIGYDAQHQGAYARKFFTGKIDYIRYKALPELD